MSGTWLGINIAASGLYVNQKALEIVGHNVANANTPGFKRQRAVIAEGNPASGAYASGTTNHCAIGTGARIQAIQRIQDEFIEIQLRGANSNAGKWQAMEQRLSAIEAVFAEPSDSAIQGALDKFWNAWQALSASPESEQLRSNVVEQASTLTARIREVYAAIRAARTDIDSEITNLVGEINRMGQEIANIDEQVSAANVLNESPNALLDKRDLLVTELSKLLGVSQYGRAGNDYIVNIGGRSMVTGSHFVGLEVTTNAEGHVSIAWADDGSPVNITNGQIAGLLAVRDEAAVDYLARLDAIATTLVEQVNTLHKSGFGLDGSTDVDFFVADGTAVDIEVNPLLLTSPRSVAASASGLPGDNWVAGEIVKLRQNINEAYGLLVSRLGADASIAKQQGEAHDLIARQFVTQQQSVSGVSLDEEMADMIRFQHAYNACARVMTAVDEMIGAIVERLGVVGR